MSINSKFFSLDYLEDFSRKLEQIAMWQRLRFYRNDAAPTAVAAASSLQWLSITGPGRGLRMRHYSYGIPPYDARQEGCVDGSRATAGIGVTVSIHTCNVEGIAGRGYYSYGTGGYAVHRWDISNNIYDVFGYLPFLFWLESIVLEFKNTNATTTATMDAQFCYYLPIATKSFSCELVTKDMPKVEYLNEIRNEFKLHHIVMCLSKQGKGKGAKNKYKLTINAPDSFRERNFYKVVEKIQKAVK